MTEMKVRIHILKGSSLKPIHGRLMLYGHRQVAEKEMYYVLRKARDDEANQNYLDILEEESDGLYIQDIIRGGVSNDDPRIPRNLSE